MEALRRAGCSREGGFCLLLIVLAASLLAGCAHRGRSRELSVDALRTLVLQHMNENAARWVRIDPSGRPSFRADSLQAIRDYAALERAARAWHSGSLGDDFLQELTGGDTSNDRVHFAYTRSLRDSPYASIRRDGTDIRVAFMSWRR